LISPQEKTMFRALAKDSIIYTFATVLSRGLQIILIPIYTRWLSPADYGVSDILNVAITFATILVTVEIIQAIARFYSVEQDLSAKREISSTGLFFVTHNYVFFAALAAGFAPQLSSFFFDGAAQAGAIRVAACAMACNGVFNYLQSQLRWDMRSFDYSIASIAYVVFSALGSIAFIIWLKLGVKGLFGGQIFGATIAGIVSFARNRKVYQFKYSLPRLKEMLSFSAPFILSSICVITSQFVDRFFIQHYCDLSSVGVYGIGIRLSSVVSLLFVGFNIALTPLIYSNAEKPSLRSDLAKLFSSFLPVAAIVGAGAFLFSKEMLIIFTTPEYYGAAKVAPLLVCGAICSSLYLFFPGMSITKDTRPIIFIGIATMIVSLGMNFLLVPRCGIIGAAIANVTTGLCSALLYCAISQRQFKIPFRILPVVVAIAVAGAGALSTCVVEWLTLPFAATIAIKSAVFAGLLFLVVKNNNIAMELLARLLRRTS
jgi:O-antigen/teichoic acid export membrane protein